MQKEDWDYTQDDHCRIGSLEIRKALSYQNIKDHCRIGSLEKHSHIKPFFYFRSLPHRQLRKYF